MRRSEAGPRPAVFRPRPVLPGPNGAGDEADKLSREPLPARHECRGGPRPCPLVRCRYNLYLDVTRHGSIRLNFPSREPWDMPSHLSCALDVADRGPAILDVVGLATNLTRERSRQIAKEAARKLLGHRFIRGCHD